MNPARVRVIEKSRHQDRPGDVHNHEEHRQQMEEHEESCNEGPWVLLIKVHQQVVSNA